MLLQQDDRSIGPPGGEIGRSAGEAVAPLESSEALDVRETDVLGALALVPVEAAVGQEPGRARIRGSESTSRRQSR